MHFDKLGIHFQYPESWSLDEEEALAGNYSVTVASPTGAFWTVAIHGPDADPAELADAALSTMRETYQDLDAEPVQDSVGQSPSVGYEMNFYCLDFINTAWVRAFQTPRATYVLFCQVEDRDLPQVVPVFEAMTKSFRG